MNTSVKAVGKRDTINIRESQKVNNANNTCDYISLKYFFSGITVTSVNQNHVYVLATVNKYEIQYVVYVDGVADRVANRVANRVAHQVANLVADRLADRAPNRVADQVAHRVAHRLAGRLADRVPDRVPDRLAHRVADWVPD